jgi:hypothetical protein
LNPTEQAIWHISYSFSAKNTFAVLGSGKIDEPVEKHNLKLLAELD